MDGATIFGILNLVFIVFLILRCVLIQERLKTEIYGLKQELRTEKKKTEKLEKKLEFIKIRLQIETGDKYDKYFQEDCE